MPLELSESVTRLRELLRIPSVSGSDGYAAAATLLQAWMGEIGMVNARTREYVTGKPVVLGSIIGKNPHLPSVLLNGHYDVVPAKPDGWSTDPFAAAVRDDGRIVARGTQDMKSVLVQYLEALRRLTAVGWTPERTVHVSFLPDEEVGGLDGAALFVNSNEFKSLNVGIALDEGLANPENAFSVFYGERASNWVILRATGPTGHGSRFVKDTAIEKMVRILTRIYSHRTSEESRCHHEHLKLGDVLSMNVTAMKAGVPSSVLRGGFAINVIPSEAEIAIDIRVPLSVTDIERVIREDWIKGEQGVDIDFVDRNVHPDPTLIGQPVADDPWVKILAQSIKTAVNVDVHLEVFPAGTDGRYIRMAGIPCIGFSPIRNTPILLHDNDEFVYEDGFLEGISVYEGIIREFTQS